MISEEQLADWMKSREGKHLEFKEAKKDFDSRKLVRYCSALANEGGGRLVLGIANPQPRRVVGTEAFSNLPGIERQLLQRLRLRVQAEELHVEGKRVLVLTVPSRPIGTPISVDGAFWMRSGEELVAMTPDHLRRIFDEAGPDFSAEVCPNATLDDLDPVAIESFRDRWASQSGNKALARRPTSQLLRDAELVLPGGVTYAALILLGTRSALGRFLAQAEVIFEYRASARPGPANQREEFRQGFFGFYDRIWELVNLRNDLQYFHERLVMHPVPTFSEIAVREALLNAVSHRDYRHPGSVFVRQFARRIEIDSPGGFPPGVTPDNILDQQYPRNRRIAEIFARCGLVERSGQGADRIVEECVRHGKPLPDYSRSDAHGVSLMLDGEIRDEDFLKFLERIGEDVLDTLDPHEFLVLGSIGSGENPPAELKPQVLRLVELGILDRTGRGKPILAKRYYSGMTRRSAAVIELDADRRRDLETLREHIEQRHAEGVPLRELLDLLPSRTRGQVRGLLQRLREDGVVTARGGSRNARWYPTR